MRGKRNGTYFTTGVAMVSAIGYVIMLIGFQFMPSAQFLKYEAKDVVFTIGGYIFGPLAAVAAPIIVAFIEMITVSDTGYIGFLMNVVAAVTFCGTATLVYHKKRTAAGAVTGLVAGTLAMTVMMLLWNYIVTPMYQEIPRDTVAKMLLPVFAPFNLIKGGLNSGLILLLYKPLMKALRSAGLLPKESSGMTAVTAGTAAGTTAGTAGIAAAAGKYRVNKVTLIAAILVIAVCAAAIVVIRIMK